MEQSATGSDIINNIVITRIPVRTLFVLIIISWTLIQYYSDCSALALCMHVCLYLMHCTKKVTVIDNCNCALQMAHNITKMFSSHQLFWKSDAELTDIMKSAQYARRNEQVVHISVMKLAKPC